ncbi:putative vesicular glutamate transporter eat-4 [Dirofilaria immitis]|nr:putative vesicular glutamate transporter eat-4 [Dirofilaria immitis]
MAMSYISTDKAQHTNSDIEANILSPTPKSLSCPLKQSETMIEKVKSILTRRKTKNIEQLHSISEKSKKRWQTAILANIGFIIAFGIRCNFGAAKGRMISNFTDPFGNNHLIITDNNNNNNSNNNNS